MTNRLYEKEASIQVAGERDPENQEVVRSIVSLLSSISKYRDSGSESEAQVEDAMIALLSDEGVINSEEAKTAQLEYGNGVRLIIQEDDAWKEYLLTNTGEVRPS